MDGAPEIPENAASWWSRWTFLWMNELMALGNRKVLAEADLYALGARHDPLAMGRRLRPRWEAERRRSNACKREQTHGVEAVPDVPARARYRLDGLFFFCGGGPSLFRALIGAFAVDFLGAVPSRVIKVLSSAASPLLVFYILYFMQASPDEEPLWRGAAAAVALFAVSGAATFAVQAFWQDTLGLSMHIRAALLDALFEKCMRRSLMGVADGTASRATEDTSVPTRPADVLVLMSNDTARIRDAVSYTHFAWASPLAVVLAMAVVWWLTSVVSVAACVVTMVVVVPTNYAVSLWMQRRRAGMMASTRERVKRAEEVVQSVRLLKLYALEQVFLDLLQAVRLRELRAMMVYQFLRGFTLSVNNLLVPLLILVCILSHVLIAGGSLSVPQVFALIATINVLRFPFSSLTEFLTNIVEARVALRRLQAFLESAEVGDPSDTRSLYRRFDCVDGGDAAVRLTGAVLTWSVGPAAATDDDTSLEVGADGLDDVPLISLSGDAEDPGAQVQQFILGPITLDLQQGELTMVVGRVASGKSSLLLGLLNEMQVVSGSIAVHGSLAYVGGEPWVMNGTVRENVVMDAEFDEPWYRTVLTSTALDYDIGIMFAGDATAVGERGISLSGGQKQRLALARAVYARRDVYVLDDPLSAVDQHVGQHLMRHCLRGVLRGRTVVVATHAIQYLALSDRVVVLERGRVRYCGPLNEIRALGFDESALLEAQGLARHTLGDSISAVNGATSGGSDSASDPVPDASLDPAPAETAAPAVAPDAATPTADRRLLSNEERARGAVSAAVYWFYFRAGLSLPLWLSAAAMFSFATMARVVQDTLLGTWARSGQHGSPVYLLPYVGSVVAVCSAVLLRELLVSLAGLESSRSIHARLVSRVIAFPMRFFETTPTGYVINRLSKDVDVIDSKVPAAVRFLADTVTLLLSIVVVLVAASLWNILSVAVVIVTFYFIQRFYRNTSRELKRLENVCDSPVFEIFSETLGGLVYVRAFAFQRMFRSFFVGRVDLSQRAFYLNVSSSRWLAVRIELLADCIVGFLALICVFQRDSLSPVVAGLALQMVLTMSAWLNWLVRYFSDVENAMNSAERVHEYVTHEVEEEPAESAALLAAYTARHGAAPSFASGALQLDNVSAYYDDPATSVLRHLTLAIGSGERVGVVGRTGAGKSSLVAAVVRLARLSGGTVRLDGKDCAAVPLATLRGAVTVIPQDPVLFEGTLRFNLDPARAHTDEELGAVLQRAQLGDGELAALGLDAAVEPRGGNLSRGQQQLLSIARAVLRRSRLVILDEATSGVDYETDAAVHHMLDKELAGCTQLIIAHRLASVLNCDRVLVLDAGTMVEFGPPKDLMQDPTSRFSALVRAMQ